MAKNALQAQLLKAGLVDDKKAKKISKQAQHAKRTGDSESIEAKKALAEAQAKKLEKDQKLNQEKQRALEEKTLKANIAQMIKQHQITETDGDISYQFVDDSKVKKIAITQKLYDQIVAGHVVIARLEESYALLPRPLADRIDTKMEGFIVVSNDTSEEVLAEDDPYAAYVIPDDLMW
ncbi:DUF2058 domain-containing protein [Psychrobacter sp. AOP22-C1-22]|uniref:DUF2058 domain-containing protein n=1 Tax=unclassified Psychrobacter TaxID=196806 RepID=UPI0017886B14|nr:MULTISPECIES: DUF2058 domain-containing protein [unclassified Psychrobacter]MBE0405980.1 DUF2058 domain-containing protein [Psychrobacter sp. FME6]MBE0445178.1 DUF2058 domain-containing protein [Psychrobacter sp. FME5]MDN5801738.1 DUF2058 domain-containing protein [Psychrobacter sp.]MDN5897710.1 DUF2058 domain-containing protein [Psychrobacter sp.]